MLDKLKTAMVLVIIGAISGFLIYATNEATYETIITARADQELDFYKDIFGLEEDVTLDKEMIDENTSELENGMIEVAVYDTDGTLIGYVYKGSETNNYGDITVLVGIKLDGTIANVVISQSTNTPTFVKKIKDDFLGNFTGQAADSVVLDSRTGASYTYGSVSKFVTEGTSYFATERGVNND